ncbi:MAG TPA: thioredoxin-dependent thiol peroxidase [Alphaproteobacteria bacterium]|nr:thioredoxin-dependent thiol peroxidase [Alphaproteobacteria bacterium]HNS45034.1 thioredoxin-dependent thiol peroxidase [Alphaproteobacteria bacterium]
MVSLSVGDKAPSFSASDDQGQKVSLKDFRGQTLVLYFYPKDDTSGCTAEACSFTENIAAFNKLNVAVVGVSKDSIESHQKFKQKYDLKFPLLSDEDGKICEAYETWVEKSMYGRKYMGTDRSTFLIGEDGKIKALWRKVKVPGHVEEILKEIKG